MRRLALFVLLAAAAAAPARAQLFDDNEARRRVELLRQQVEAYKKATEERLTKAEATAQSAADRTALLDLASQIESLRGEIAKMRGQLEVITNQAETAEARQKQLYLDIDTRLRGLGLVAEHLELAAHLRDLAAQALDRVREIEQRGTVGGRRRGGFGLGDALVGRFAVRLDLLAQELDAAARLVVVEQLSEGRCDQSP